MRIEKKGGVELVVFDNLNQTKLVKQCFTTRRGGVSQGYFGSMKMGLTRGEDRELVQELFGAVLCTHGSFQRRPPVISSPGYNASIYQL